MQGGVLPSRSGLAHHWGLDEGLVFLNHGSFGACPHAVLNKQSELRARLEREPIRFIVDELEGLLDEARCALAGFLNADAEGLAFVTNATTGVNAVMRNLRLSPGDELLTNNHEYNACNNALRFEAARAGASVVVAEIPFPIQGEDEVVGALLRSATERTKLCMVSHVTSVTGLIFPVERIVREMAARGIDTLVDGAHAPGMIETDLTRVNAAYYTGNCHKWMCAPKGAAFLHVRADRRAGVDSLTIDGQLFDAAKNGDIYIIAATEKGTQNYYNADFTGPLAIIMGSEENGVSDDILRVADELVKIPLLGSISSLNVSVASGILLYEAIRQRSISH